MKIRTLFCLSSALFITMLSGCNTIPEREISYSGMPTMKIWITKEYLPENNAKHVNHVYTQVTPLMEPTQINSKMVY